MALDEMICRPDYFVSLCLAQEGDVVRELDAIAALADACEQNLKYWEIVYVIGESFRSSIEALLNASTSAQNLRIVLVRDAVGYYRRRVIAASEAIGDVVVVTSVNEAAEINVIAFAAAAVASDQVVLGRRIGRSSLRSALHWVVGRISNHRVDDRDLKTIALPRARLATILRRPTASIDLRFEPKRGVADYLRKELRLTNTGGEVGLRQRVDLLTEIIASSAARFLNAIALLSALVAASATSYAVYAVGVIVFHDNVQPGWFSTAIVQSGSTAFISLGIGVIALGIATVVDRMEGGIHHEFIDELGNISLSARAHDLNVDIMTEARRVEIK
jgi:polyisoprenyl-phosphate glycosyltransferase